MFMEHWVKKSAKLTVIKKIYLGTWKKAAEIIFTK